MLRKVYTSVKITYWDVFFPDVLWLHCFISQSSAYLYCHTPPWAMTIWNSIPLRMEGPTQPNVSGDSPGNVRCTVNPGVLNRGGVWKHLVYGGVWKHLACGGVWKHLDCGGVWKHLVYGGVWKRLACGGVWKHLVYGGVWKHLVYGGVWKHVDWPIVNDSHVAEHLLLKNSPG